ncbi:MAG: hypothetical protein P1V35_12625, partial [Planctomycetota bacterium]|nr:hypothetical protein [Planctomycetota bacterium]
MRASLTIVPLLSVMALAPFAAPQTLQHATVAGTLANSSGASTQVESMGDVNGDGLEDFLIWGLAQHFPWEQEEARVHSGSDGALLHRTTLGSAVEFPEYSLGVLGDLDSDGVLDFARGGTRLVGNQWEGFVRIFSGMTGATILEIPYSANLFPAGDVAGFGQGI